MKLSGVICLHEISQTRMLGTSRKNIRMFNKLCGDEGTKNVILATTKWEDINPEFGQQRERQLIEVCWKDMIKLGSRMHRFMTTSESAWAAINLILKNSDKPGTIDTFQMQEELVEFDKILAETEQRNVGERDELQEVLEENERKLRSTLQQVRVLKVPFTRRIRAFFGFVGVGRSFYTCF